MATAMPSGKFCRPIPMASERQFLQSLTTLMAVIRPARASAAAVRTFDEEAQHHKKTVTPMIEPTAPVKRSVIRN